MIYLLMLWPIVGVIQLIGAVIRTLCCSDWTTPYGRGLKNYWFAVLAFAVIMFGLFDERHVDDLFGPMIVLSIPVAIYYWIVVYGLAKTSTA
jgi:hypothetical protein